jgi:prevent-host-death family protein
MSAHVVNTHEAKSRLSELIREAEAGTDVIVARNGRPVAKIIPWPPARAARSGGAWRGRVDYGSDDIVASDPDVTEAFERSTNDACP